MTRLAMRIVACVVILALPPQALALAMQRMWGPAHFHFNAASDVANWAGHRPFHLGHPTPKHLDEHHRSVIGFHHHEAHDLDVVYIGHGEGDHDPLQSDLLERIHGGLELIATSVQMAATDMIQAAISAVGPQRFCSHICDPPDRPPR